MIVARRFFGSPAYFLDIPSALMEKCGGSWCIPLRIARNAATVARARRMLSMRFFEALPRSSVAPTTVNVLT